MSARKDFRPGDLVSIKLSDAQEAVYNMLAPFVSGSISKPPCNVYRDDLYDVLGGWQATVFSSGSSGLQNYDNVVAKLPEGTTGVVVQANEKNVQCSFSTDQGTVFGYVGRDNLEKRNG